MFEDHKIIVHCDDILTNVTNRRITYIKVVLGSELKPIYCECCGLFMFVDVRVLKTQESLLPTDSVLNRLPPPSYEEATMVSFEMFDVLHNLLIIIFLFVLIIADN